MVGRCEMETLTASEIFSNLVAVVALQLICFFPLSSEVLEKLKLIRNLRDDRSGIEGRIGRKGHHDHISGHHHVRSSRRREGEEKSGAVVEA